MSVLCMCPGDGCRLSEHCYRFAAVPSGNQSFYLTPPLNCDGSCDYFIPCYGDVEALEEQVQ